MIIKKEITDFLDKTNNAHSQTDRNIDIVHHFYGFTGEIGSTLDWTGQHFGITRERVRQILNRYFRDLATISLFPNLMKCENVIKSRKIWAFPELKFALEKAVGGKLGTHPLNVLSLIRDLSGSLAYDTFDCNIQRIYRPTDQCFVIHKLHAKKFNKLMKAVRTVPGIVGVVDTDELDTGDISIDLVRKAILMHPESWTKTIGTKLYYLYEDRDNFLINASEKVFSIFNEVPLNRLVEALTNSLRRRSSKFTYPTDEIIESFIRASSYFDVSNGIDGDVTVRFLGKKVDLSPIETAVATKLKSDVKTTYSELFDYLSYAGFHKPSIDKAILASPIVFVDKSLGQRYYTYSLVGQIAA